MCTQHLLTRWEETSEFLAVPACRVMLFDRENSKSHSPNPITHLSIPIQVLLRLKFSQIKKGK